ncbi:dynamin family protein, partial [Sulfurimonas sp. SAG-AH-194-C21]
SKVQEAKVFYWNKQEWNKLLVSAKEIAAMQEFVDEAHASFGESLDEYILEESRVDSVDVKKLSDFTSAKASTKMCNLIKYVSLGCDVDFLQEGIEIVDTPGLDDLVVQREEITKEYIAKCDMMFHLMNVAQSATLKDVSFIIDALLYQNVSKLLVVITRADTVSKKELSEVINYTKKSIKEELHKQNKDSKLEYILQTIEFIPISALMALLHKTGREDEAKAAGFTLKDTGIIEIQNYLHKNLFGSSSIKSELIIRSCTSQLLNIIKHQEDSLIYELSLCAKSKEELKAELQKLIQKKEKDTNTIQIIQEDIRHYKSSLDKELLSLQNFLSVEFTELETLIRQRLVSDVRYSLEQTKTLPQNTRLRSIIETAIKDGIIDIIRE